MVDFNDIDMGEFGRHLFQKLLKATASEVEYADVLDLVSTKKLENYVDESFPPNEFSLIHDWDDPEVRSKVRIWR